MYHYVIPFSYIHVPTDWPVLYYIMCSIACGHTPIPILNVWSEGGVVALHVKQCLQTCCFVVFSGVSKLYSHTKFQFHNLPH